MMALLWSFSSFKKVVLLNGITAYIFSFSFSLSVCLILHLLLFSLPLFFFLFSLLLVIISGRCKFLCWFSFRSGS